MGGRLSRKLVRYFFLLTLFMITGIQILSAQWIKQSPVPTGEEIRDACFINSDTGWIFGFNGTVLRTNDGGSTWLDQSVPSSYEIYVGLFLDGNHGWIAAADEYQNKYGHIYGTTDGGNTWNLQFLNNDCAIRDLSFINPDTGWALAYCQQFDPVAVYRNFFLKTNNGGDNWFVLDSLDKSYFRKMDFINDSLGYIAGAGTPNLMKTVDGGMSWQASPHASNAGLTDICFTDAANGYSCGNNFYYTHNSGASWNYTYCYFANGVDMYDEFNGWTFTINKVYKVTNGGENVDYQFTSDKSILADISALDSANAYAVGRNVSIFSTNDGGYTWQEISNGTRTDLYSVFFLNENDGWTGGSEQTLLSTHDGGRHWNYHDVYASTYTINDIQFINPDTGWFVDGDVHMSTDGGLSWSQTTGWIYPITDLFFFNYQFGWCTGSEGRLYKSVNGGNDWQEKISGTDKDLKAVYFTDENTGWIAGNGIVKKTTDGGENWEEKYIGKEQFLKIQFCNDSLGYILAGDLYLKTYTGGESWQAITPEGMTGLYMEDLCFVSQDTGYLSGSDYLLKTTDGGATWEGDPGFPDIQSHAIFFADGLKGWIVGAEGAIYHCETGVIGSIYGPDNDDNLSSYVIFPNPSGDIVNIKYRLESAEDFEIGIFTLQGTRIRHYREPVKNPGNYSFIWDPDYLPSGIYLFKIRIGDISYSEKIVFVK